MDSVYDWDMTISLMNAGRGAGKTHALVEWAKLNRSRYVVGTTDTRTVMREAGLEKQFVFLNDVEESFKGMTNYEVAFDDFGTLLERFLSNDLRLHAAKSVILATNLPVWEGAPKKTEIPTSDWYSEVLKKKYGAGIELLEDVLQNGAEALGPLLGVVSPDGWRKSNGFSSEGPEPESAEEEVVPDTKQVRMDELRLGDVVVGRGSVLRLWFLDGKQRVQADLKADGFEGTLKKLRSSLVEIENR